MPARRIPELGGRGHARQRPPRLQPARRLAMDVRLRCCSRPPRRRLAFSRHAGVLLGATARRGTQQAALRSDRALERRRRWRAARSLRAAVVRADARREYSEVIRSDAHRAPMHLARLALTPCLTRRSAPLLGPRVPGVCPVDVEKEECYTYTRISAPLDLVWRTVHSWLIASTARAAESPLHLRSVWSSRLRVTHATWSGARGFEACGAALSRAC